MTLPRIVTDYLAGSSSLDRPCPLTSLVGNPVVAVNVRRGGAGCPFDLGHVTAHAARGRLDRAGDSTHLPGDVREMSLGIHRLGRDRAVAGEAPGFVMDGVGVSVSVWGGSWQVTQLIAPRLSE